MAPQTQAGDATHAMKYRDSGETFRDTTNRVAAVLRDNDEHYHEFRDILGDMRFMPGGRVQAAIGSTKNVTAISCFVSGAIADSYVEGDGSIMQRATEAAATMRMGGGMGYNFSSLRPKGALIKKLQSHSGGPIPFMEIFNSVCLATASSGHRRGAQMGVLSVDHPDIEEFVNVKHNNDAFGGFNLSIAVTDKFMEAVGKGTGFDLVFGGEVYRTVDAQALWEAIMRSTWDWAEPGVLFIDTINRMNNLSYCETISATNPCSEQPLPPFGACLLGSFNLTKYIKRQPIDVAKIRSGVGFGFSFDFDQFEHDIPFVVRAMDNVTDRSLYPLPQQRQEAHDKRRMGLGITGLANAAEAMGYAYGSKEFLEFEGVVMNMLTHGCYRTGVALAREKGAFAKYDERYCESVFIKTLDPEIQQGIREHGIRCSHFVSVAPTGTISMSADNISSGIEPVFSYSSRRPINTPDGPVEMVLEDYGVKFFGVRGRRAEDVSIDEHLGALRVAQTFVDSAVSKTINCTGKTPWEDFKDIYKTVWEFGGKGCSTFNQDGKRFGLIQSTDAKVEEACTFDIATGQRSCA